MLQKFALALKSKTAEFFAEDEEDDLNDQLDNNEHHSSPNLPSAAAAAAAAFADLDAAPEEVITGQCVVVLKPDPPDDPHTLLLPSLLAALSSFRAAYLYLQTAHSPLDPDALRAADRSAVSHLRRLSDLKLSFHARRPPTPLLHAQVQDNQTLLRALDAVVNRLQSDIDRRDADATSLRNTLNDINAANSKLARRLDRACSPPDDRVETLLSLSVFDAVLRDSCHAVHRFTRLSINLMSATGWDLDSAADSIYPNVNYAKPGHRRYAILSYICLRMFEGFDSDDFGTGEGHIGRSNSLRHFIEHSAVDPLELNSSDPSCGFAVFCKKKYQQLMDAAFEPSLFGNFDHSLQPLSPLYEPFISMASSVWTLHKLAWAYNPIVEIFQVGRGKEFSLVYMETIVRSSAQTSLDRGTMPRPKVGFTVIPGFRVGKTAIQCRVYLEGS